ncbi:hypothetical protein CEXT_181571 [Caerostris extrusa]|uniref:Uncharacterized protein n=1 Tax=Caerostris extrusa TaxID=172846 RepID=A0AAV4Q2B3_CAEEX|nr:hypothetical protein CEXT_181571 [Caerostris extrusa]
MWQLKDNKEIKQVSVNINSNDNEPWTEELLTIRTHPFLRDYLMDIYGPETSFHSSSATRHEGGVFSFRASEAFVESSGGKARNRKNEIRLVGLQKDRIMTRGERWWRERLHETGN